MGLNTNINFDVVGLIKYIHSNWLRKKVKKNEYEHNLKVFIMHFNLLIDEEASILRTLLENNNKPIVSTANDYLSRLIQVGLVFVIPNSDKSLQDKRKLAEQKEAQEKGFRILGSYYAPESVEYLFALTPDAFELLQYLKNENKIFTEEEKNNG